MPDWLAGIGGAVLTSLAVRHLLLWPLRKARRAARGEDAVPAVPFCEAQYAANAAASRDYDLQQAVRRAGRLAHRGRAAEAVAVLVGVRAAAADPAARDVLDAEIRRLGGTPPADGPSNPGGPPPCPGTDPYADRL